MHIPEIMLPHDLARATIWECGKDFWDIGNEVGDCCEMQNLRCGGKNNGHPALTYKGANLFFELDKKSKFKVTKAFFWSHFLYGHDTDIYWNPDGQSFPTCSYCFRDGEWSPQDEYIREYKNRQDPDWAEKMYNRYKDPVSVGGAKVTRQQRTPPRVMGGNNTAPLPGESVTEYIKRDANYMANLKVQANLGFKQRAQLLKGKFTNLTES